MSETVDADLWRRLVAFLDEDFYAPAKVVVADSKGDLAGYGNRHLDRVNAEGLALNLAAAREGRIFVVCQEGESRRVSELSDGSFKIVEPRDRHLPPVGPRSRPSALASRA